MKYYRTFSISRLYHRYLKGSPIEGQFSVEELARRLEILGWIRILDAGRYEQLKNKSRIDFLKSIQRGEL